MTNKRKVTPSLEKKLSINNTLIFISAGFGIFLILFILLFFAFNIGKIDQSVANGSAINAVASTNWHSKDTWDLNRRPANHEEIIIPADKEVTITSTEWLENVSVIVYGTIRLANGRLKLDASSTISIASGGNIISSLGNADQITIGDQTWMGSEINENAEPPYQFSAGGINAIELLQPETDPFRARLNRGNSELLEWATISESDSEFIPERSNDGRDFMEFALINRNKNVQNRRIYQVEDDQFQAFKDRNLREANIDGNLNLSAQSIRNEFHDVVPDSKAITVLGAGPNPFSDQFTIKYVISEPNEVAISLYSQDGQLVHNETVMPQLGVNTFQFTATHATKPGIYIVNLDYNGKSEQLRLIKN